MFRRLLGARLIAILLVTPANPAQAAKSPRHRVDVMGVTHTSDGQYVVILRTQKPPHRYLPIWIGETEALHIQLAMERQAPPRPLTLNLLKSVLDSGKIEVREIAIDDLKAGVFLGKIRLRQQKRTWSIDARPSDAIGLAAGAGIPIWVSEHVLKDAAVDPNDLTTRPDTGTSSNANVEETL